VTAAAQAAPALAEQPITIVAPPPGPRARALIARAQTFLSPSLIHCYPLYVERAQGCMVQDVDGNVYLDCMAGIAVAATGHCHPQVAAAIKRQVDTLIHICGTDFHYAGYGALCETLSRLAPGGTNDWQTFLTNSGTEGVEAAIKLARHHTGRHQLIAFRGGFHGRSLGSLSLTASKPKYRTGFGPLLPGVHHASYGVMETIEHDLFTHTVAPEEIAAIVVEPILGEGGYIVPPAAFLRRLRELADRHGIMLVFDEVQCGLGRTGKMFAAEHFGVVPDIIIVAKGIASGLPLGAMMARRSIMTWPSGSHGSTCGGNPVSIAAALATFQLLEDGLVQNAARVGAHLKAGLDRALAGHPSVTDVRGLGLMIGVELDSHDRAEAVANLCFERGLLLLTCGKKAIRLSPPLTLSEAQADVAVTVLAGAVRDAPHGP